MKHAILFGTVITAVITLVMCLIATRGWHKGTETAANYQPNSYQQEMLEHCVQTRKH